MLSHVSTMTVQREPCAMRGMSLPLCRPVLVVRGAGNGGPRRLDRQPGLAACSHGKRESITNGARHVVTVP